MTSRKRKKISREELKPGEVLCQYCNGKCCRYFALPIDRPTRSKDFDFIRWYLLHEGATVFTDDSDWYLLVHAKCKHLGEDSFCQCYESRPQICRDYSTDVCEYEDDWTYEQYFETPEQIQEYVDAVFQKPAREIRGPRPKEAAIVQ